MDLKELETIAAKCNLCDLYKGRIKPVFAKGDDNADILICGMCPGHEENIQGVPFVGSAGKILDEILFRSFSIKNKVYITNIVKCYVKAGTKLESGWMNSCIPYFIVQITMVKPKVIIALGRDVSNFLLNNNDDMGTLRGSIHNYMNMKLIPTYHPSFLARGGGIKHKHFHTVVNDFKQSLQYI